MSRKPKKPSIACEHFTWNFFQRNGVYYADGRSGKYKLGKYSLSTRDRDEAIERLKILDIHKAIELGLAKPEAARASIAVSIAEGWEAFMVNCNRSPVMGGVSDGTSRRYSTVRNKHTNFCFKHGIADWLEFTKAVMEKYGNWLAKHGNLRTGKGLAYRTILFELTLLKIVNSWLIDNKMLCADARIVYPLAKLEGTDTYCYTREEVAAMVKHCQATPKLHWLADMMIALAHLGVRIGELSGLRWSDVNLDHNVIKIADERASPRKQQAGTARTTKGKRSRNIPIHPRLREVLSKMQRSPDGYVFHAERGGPLRQNNARKAFVKSVIEPLKGQFPTPEGEIGFEQSRRIASDISSSAKPSWVARRRAKSANGLATLTVEWLSITAILGSTMRCGRWKKSTLWTWASKSRNA